MQAINITAYTEDSSQVEAIKAVMKALKIKFEIAKEKPYNAKFVDMVLDAEKQIKDGKSTKLTSKGFDNLWK